MSNIRLRHVPALLFFAALIAWPLVARARPVAISREVPAAQAIANVQAWIKAHPADAAACCALGRIHALAWAYGEKIPLVDPGTPNSLPSFSEASTVLVSRTGPNEIHFVGNAIVSGEQRTDRPITAVDAQHLAASIAAYRQAIQLNPHDALSELGLARMLAQQGAYVRDLPADYFSDPKPTDTQAQTWNQAIKALADADPIVRDAASKSLSQAMPGCILFLRAAKSDDPESEARIDAILHGHFDLQALDHYRKAFELQAIVDLKTDPTYQVDSQISARAGTQILALLAKNPDAARKDEPKSIQAVLDPLAKKMQQLMMMPE